MRPRADRTARLFSGGNPRWVRCYDDGGRTADRYTVVFTGRYGSRTGGRTWVLGMSASPFHPQGVGMRCEYEHRIDRPTSRHLGKRIRFDDLPPDCQRLALWDYCSLWDIEPTMLASPFREAKFDIR